MGDAGEGIDWRRMAERLIGVLEAREANEKLRIERQAETDQLRIREVDSKDAQTRLGLMHVLAERAAPPQVKETEQSAPQGGGSSASHEGGEDGGGLPDAAGVQGRRVQVRAEVEVAVHDRAARD